MTNKELYEELVNILRVTHSNVSYEERRTNSELLHNVAITLNNLTTLVQNISTDVSSVEQSRKLECALKNEAYYFIIESGLLNEFKNYIERTRNK